MKRFKWETYRVVQQASKSLEQQFKLMSTEQVLAVEKAESQIVSNLEQKKI